MNDNTIDQALRHYLYRHDCPEPLTLGDFHLQLLDDAAAAAVARHLARCPHCEAEMTQLAHFVAPSATEKLTTRFRLLIARLVNGLADNTDLTLATATAFRGAEAATQTYSTQEHQIALTFDEDIEQPDKFALDGFITGVEQPAEFRADLWHDETWVATTYVDELGNFTFSGLSEAIFELIVHGPRLEIHIAALTP